MSMLRRYAPGESPFRVRGSTYLGMRAHVDAHVDGGMEAVRPHLPDDAHRAFATQIFLPVGVYDALPIPTFARAIAAAEHKPMEESVRERARVVARRDLSGLYRLLLKVVSAEAVIERLQRASLRYFDFGRVEVLTTSRGRSVGAFSEMPHALVPWFMPMITGYATEVLQAAGGNAPRVRFDAPIRGGVRHGVELVTLRFAFTWS